MAHTPTTHPTHKDDDEQGGARQTDGGPVTATPRDTQGADQTRLLLLLAGDLGQATTARTPARSLRPRRFAHRRRRAAGQRRRAARVADRRGADMHDGQLERRADRVCLCVAGRWRGQRRHRGDVYRQTGGRGGHSLACVVTATNAMGSTVAPMSNAVAIPAV